MSAEQSTPAKPSMRDRMLTLDQLRALPPAEPMIDRLLFQGTLAQLSGPPGCFKTFVSVGWACALSAGVDWAGHRVPTKASVLYVAAEGANGLARRIDAWRERYDTDTGDLITYPEPLQLGDEGQVRELIQIATEDQTGLIIYDTRARCTAGLEENSATDQGKAIAAAERIRVAANGTGLVIHHAGLNGGHGRGSTAWDGGVWSDIRMTREGMKAKIHTEKHKDAPDDENFLFDLVPHQKTLVAFPTSDGNDLVEDTASTAAVREIFEKLVGIEGATRPQVVALAVERGISKSSAYRSITALVKTGEVVNVGTSKTPRWLIPLPDSGDLPY